MERKIHQGKNISRFRQMLGIKQDALASLLGDDWNQIKISRLEAKEDIDDELLEQVAKVLKVPASAIKSFDEETSVINIQNNYEGSNQGATGVEVGSQNTQFIVNPLEKYLEAVEEIKKLYAALLQAKEEQIRLMEKLVEKGK